MILQWWIKSITSCLIILNYVIIIIKGKVKNDNQEEFLIKLINMKLFDNKNCVFNGVVANEDIYLHKEIKY